jgi:hypothetical protein
MWRVTKYTPEQIVAKLRLAIVHGPARNYFRRQMTAARRRHLLASARQNGVIPPV